MIEQKKKLRLDELEVDSFVTHTPTIIKGGTMTDNIGGCLTGLLPCDSVVQGYCDSLYENQTCYQECQQRSIDENACTAHNECYDWITQFASCAICS